MGGGGGFSGILLDVRELQNKNKAGADFFANGGLFLFSCANACQIIDDGLLVETEGLGQGSAPEPDLIVRKVQIFQCVTNLFTTLEKGATQERRIMIVVYYLLCELTSDFASTRD